MKGNDIRNKLYNNIDNQLLQIIGKVVVVKHRDYMLARGGHCATVMRKVKGRLVNYWLHDELGLVVVLDTKEGLVSINQVETVSKCGLKRCVVYTGALRYSNEELNKLLNTNISGGVFI